MAKTESTRAPRKPSVKQLAKDNETVLVPFLPQPYAKAPATDPYLRAGTVTAEALTICGYTLPPILRGIQPGLGLSGEPTDYSVKVVWASRQHVDGMLAAIGQAHPDLHPALQVVRAYMLHLDTIRDEAKLGVMAARGWINKEHPTCAGALENLQTVTGMLGRWRDEARLHLR